MADLLTALLASYPLDADGHDASRNGLHLTPEGTPTYDDDLGAVILDGATQALSRISDIGVLDNLGAVTFAARCYLEAVAGANQTIVAIQCATGVLRVARLLYVGVDDRLAFEAVTGAETNAAVEVVPPALQTWFDLRGWVDPDEGEIGIQLGGATPVTVPFVGLKQVAASGLFVGRRGDPADTYWHGMLDAVTLAGRVWSDAEWARWRVNPVWPFRNNSVRCPSGVSANAGITASVGGVPRTASLNAGRRVTVTCG